MITRGPCRVCNAALPSRVYGYRLWSQARSAAEGPPITPVHRCLAIRVVCPDDRLLPGLQPNGEESLSAPRVSGVANPRPDLALTGKSMPVQSIDHINIRAPRELVAAMKDFYEGVLGLSVGWRPPFRSTGHWLYRDDRPLVHLVEDEAVQKPAGSRGPIVDHVAFSCTGLDDFERLLTGKGIGFRRTQVPETTIVQLIFTDPAGNGVELQFADAGA